MLVTPADSTSRLKEIRIFPERDLKILRAAAQLIAAGEEPKPYRISKLLKKKGFSISQQRVEGRLQSFNEYYPELLKFIKGAKKTRYFQLTSISRRVKLSQSRLEEAAREGYYIGAPRPYGYIKNPARSIISTLTKHPTEISKARQVIEGYYVHGKTLKQLREETGLRKSQIHDILFRNIRFYAGYVKFRGNFYLGKHARDAIIDKKFWQTYIEPVLQTPKPLYHPRRQYPTGLVWRFRRWEHDEKAQKVRDAWDLRLKGVGLNEISSKVDIPASTLVAIFKNPVYANKIRIVGKQRHEWPDAGVPPIVTLEEWLAVQKIRDPRPLWLASKEARKKKVEKLVNDIFVYIARHEPTTRQVREEFRLTIGQTDDYLRRLRRKGVIDKLGGKRGKWYVKTPQISDET